MWLQLFKSRQIFMLSKMRLTAVLLRQQQQQEQQQGIHVVRYLRYIRQDPKSMLLKFKV